MAAVISGPVLQGYLKKKSSNIFGAWNTRYWVLDNTSLSYYKNDVRKERLGECAIHASR